MSALLLPVLGLLAPLQDTTPVTAQGLQGLDMTRYALVCLGLVAMILVLGWGFKRLLAGNLRLRAGQRSMSVVDVLPLGGKRQLAVVRCYDRTFLLGLGERDVSLVTELDVDEDVEGTLPQRAAKPQVAAAPKPARFGGLLQSALERWSPPDEAPRPADPDPRAEREARAAVELTRTAPAPTQPEPAPAPETASPSLGRGVVG
jgi:flagellar biogenesis protein FliO